MTVFTDMSRRSPSCYSFAKENGLGGGFVFPVRFVHCKYITSEFKKEYSKPTIFLLKSYRNPTIFKNSAAKIGIKSVSGLSADSLLIFLAIVSFSAWYAPGYRIDLSLSASLFCMIFTLRLFTSLFQRNILFHGFVPP